MVRQPPTPGELMKQFIYAIITTSSILAFAGPEDHIYDSCYTAAKPVFSQLPSDYCFEAVNLDARYNVINFSGYAHNLPDVLKLKSSFKVSEDIISFVASGIVLDEWENGCRSGRFAELIVSGTATNAGKVNPKGLKMYLNYKVTNDTCHSQANTGAEEYKLSK
jgi:hypothetical protein